MHRPFALFIAFSLFASSLVAQVAGGAGTQITTGARAQIGVTTSYDPAYVKLTYPGGDVPLNTGVCTDVVVRALRSAGIDLQKEVHEDMRKNFSTYPQT